MLAYGLGIYVGATEYNVVFVRRVSTASRVVRSCVQDRAGLVVELFGSRVGIGWHADHCYV